MDENYRELNQSYQDLVDKMTLEEKASMCSGQDYWRTKAILNLDIPGIMVTDGPHGLRKQISEKSADGMGISQPATCFPSACALACSFDRDLMYKMGQALAQECLDQEVSVLLGPGINIKRSPLCGRNFEYFSEDPYAAGEMSASLIRGIQSRNVGTSLKHFAANSQEKARMVCDSVIDERALREIYLRGFENAVKNAKPWTLMCSYNKVNGTYASESKELLTDILRMEWGFDGIVMSDWGAVNIREEGLAAGLELEMPYSGGINDRRIAAAVKNRTLPEEVLDTAVIRLLKLINMTRNNKRPMESPYSADNELSKNLALESAVLLRNDGLLPVKKDKKIALIGAFAKAPRYQGSGSSRINPVQVSNAFDVFTKNGVDFVYADGYSLTKEKTDDDLIKEAVQAARGRDAVFIFAGLPDEYESEGFDRTHLDLPESHNRLISEIAKVNSQTVVVLYGGAPVLMPWLDEVRSVLMCYLPGQNAGEAVFDLLFGNAVPCGKLAETFPLSLSDSPSFLNFSNSKTVEYRESIYVGYRYYDSAHKNVLFPFGFGLSYSTFSYSNISADKTDLLDTDTVTVTLDIENTGEFDAAEIVQIYVQPPESVIYKASRELKGFAKIRLKKAQTGSVSFCLEKASFSYFNTDLHDWHVESGTYTILAAASSRDIRLAVQVNITSTAKDVSVPDYRKKAPEYYDLSKNDFAFTLSGFESVCNRKMPDVQKIQKGSYHLNSTLSDLDHSVIGRIFTRTIHRRYKAIYREDPRPDQIKMMEAMLEDMPLRALVNFSGGELGFEVLSALLLMMNGHIWKGLTALILTIGKKQRN